MLKNRIVLCSLRILIQLGLAVYECTSSLGKPKEKMENYYMSICPNNVNRDFYLAKTSYYCVHFLPIVYIVTSLLVVVWCQGH